jgi:hypothetical protein
MERPRSDVKVSVPAPACVCTVVMEALTIELKNCAQSCAVATEMGHVARDAEVAASGSTPLGVSDAVVEVGGADASNSCRVDSLMKLRQNASIR